VCSSDLAGLGGDSLSLTVKESQLDKLDRLSEGVKGLSFVRNVRTIDHGLDIRVESPEKSLPAVLEVANRIDCQVDGVEYHRPRLDDVFVSFTGHALKGEYPEPVEE
jgi:ABC-2 type transport system ATP-binding protein